MKYPGSKDALSKFLLPFIHAETIKPETQGYLEAFVGGANMIDKVDSVNKIGCDLNRYLIALLQRAKEFPGEFESEISREDYEAVRENKDNFPDWYVGFVGFCGSFNSLFFNGYAGKSLSKEGKYREYDKEAITNLNVQSHQFYDVIFRHSNYSDLKTEEFKGYVIYCDPPYIDTLNYKGVEEFNHAAFYDWCREMALYNVVFVSESYMPEDFVCIWERGVSASLQRGVVLDRIERLYKLDRRSEIQ